MDWDKLKIFHAVAEAGSFTSATVILNISQSALSRQMQALEQEILLGAEIGQRIELFPTQSKPLPKKRTFY